MFDYYLSFVDNRLRGKALVKVFVVYDSKYGNTKLVAESILKGISEVERIETSIGYVKEVDVGKVADYDVIVLGAPKHMGTPSLTIKRFINRLSELDLKAKYVAVFGTYAGRIRAIDRAVKKLQKMVEKKLPKVINIPLFSFRKPKSHFPFSSSLRIHPFG